VSLFPAGTAANNKTRIPCICTPIGSLCVSVCAPIGNSVHGHNFTVRLLPSGAFVYECQAKQVEVEILLLVLPLPESRFGVVSGCEAAVVRLRAAESVGGLLIACRWEQTPSEATSGPENGENLDAHTWETSSTCVTIGTKDGEALAANASRDDWMPSRLKSVFSLDTVMHLADGLAVPIAGLERGELCQVHFIVAWSPPRVGEDVATWLAVDRRPDRILEQAGCA
jgi:hypothetical protein